MTYGAGGTTRDRTNTVIQTILDRAHLTVAGHLTCVGATREETLEVARGYARMGVRRIVALRGDPPKGATRFEPHPGGFASAAELVAALADLGGFDIAVAAYPEVHPEASSPAADIENLKRKFDAGASIALSQFFFENEDFLRFRDACVRAGITAPILPGLLPIENFPKMLNFAARCRARVPVALHEAFASATTPEAAYDLSVEIAAGQAADLAAEGAEHIHIYTLNNPDLSYDVCRRLGYGLTGAHVAGGAA